MTTENLLWCVSMFCAGWVFEHWRTRREPDEPTVRQMEGNRFLVSGDRIRTPEQAINCRGLPVLGEVFCGNHLCTSLTARQEYGRWIVTAHYVAGVKE